MSSVLPVRPSARRIPMTGSIAVTSLELQRADRRTRVRDPPTQSRDIAARSGTTFPRPPWRSGAGGAHHRVAPRPAPRPFTADSQRTWRFGDDAVRMAGERLLLVDDEDNLRSMLQAALRHMGFEVHPVASGREALDA